MKILVLNGPNINLLGIREKEMYGHDDYVALCQYIQSTAHELGITVDVQQTNSEGEMVTLIQEAWMCTTDWSSTPAPTPATA